MPKKSHLDLSPKRETEDEEPTIAAGFDRGIDYDPMKDRLIKRCNRYYNELLDLEKKTPHFKYKIKIVKSKILYCCIAMIQLRNGSRISEACSAMK